MEPFLMEFEARRYDEDLLVSHEGQEFLYLLEGEVDFYFGEEVMRIGPGDSVFYDSREPHAFVAVSETAPRGVAVLSSKEP